jgi:hypothetical protein
MTATQARFRRLLALYPADWQASHGEAYLGVMLDVADAEGRTGPTAREVLAVARHATAAWTAEAGRRADRDRALRSLRWAGLAAVASGCVLSIVMTVLAEWVPGVARTPPTGGFVDERTAFVIHSSGVVVYALWGVVLALVLLRQDTAARRTLVVAAVAPSLLAVTGPLPGLPLQPYAGQLGAFTMFAVAGALLWPARPTRHERGAWLLGTALLSGTAVAGVYLAFSGVIPYERPGELLGAEFSLGFGLALIDVVVTPVVVGLVVGGVLLVRRRPGLLVTAVLVGQPWFVMLHAGTPGYATRRILAVADLPLLAAGSSVLLAVAGTVALLRVQRAAGRAA